MTYLGDIASDMPGRYMGRETYLEEQGAPGGHPHRHQGTWCSTLREAIQKKNLFLFGFFQFGLDPPPRLVFWNPSRYFFLPFFLIFSLLQLPYIDKGLLSQCLWISWIDKNYLFSSYLQFCLDKNVPHHLWNQVDPPPFLLKNVQTQAEKFLESFGIR